MRQNLHGDQRDNSDLFKAHCNAKGNNLKYKHEYLFPYFFIHDFVCKSHTSRVEWRLNTYTFCESSKIHT